MLSEGHTQRQIVARIGCSQKGVCKVLKSKLLGSVVDKNIPGRKRKTTYHEDKLIVTQVIKTVDL